MQKTSKIWRVVWITAIAVAVAGLALYIAKRALLPGEQSRPPAVLDVTASRTLPMGKVVGAEGTEPGSQRWLGLPYAEPPVGDLRWRSPREPQGWSGVREALTFANSCVQYPSPLGIKGDPLIAGGSEDCLYLNVYAPKMTEASVQAGEHKVPVLVWIHGGGNVFGDGSTYTYDGSILAAREKVIVVTINYRLGPFGWFRHAALRDGISDALEKSGNFGLLDQIQALRWVRTNISAFGGDPNLVTVFGESAGAKNIYALLLAKEAAGLFHRAIIESGGTGIESTSVAENWSDDPEKGHPYSSNEALGKMLINAGRAKDRDAAKALVKSVPAKEIEGFLRARTPAEVMAAYKSGGEESTIRVPYLFADGALLPAEAEKALLAKSDGWNRVPVLVGTNRDENKLFMFLNNLYVKNWFGVIRRVRDPDLFLATADAISSLWTLGTENLANGLAEHSQDVFVYRFDFNQWPNLLGFETSKYLGAAHGLEIPFVFGSWELGSLGPYIFTEENKAARESLSDAMRSYWVNFAKTGKPGKGLEGKFPEWQPWGNERGKMFFDSANGGGVRMKPQSAKMGEVIEAIQKDPRLKNQRDRCWVFREIAGHVATKRDFQRADYEKLDCASYPFDRFPWQD